MPSTATYIRSYNVSMKVLRKKVQAELMNRKPIDFSNVKPPTKHAVHAMVKNLRAAAKNSNKSL